MLIQGGFTTEKCGVRKETTTPKPITGNIKRDFLEKGAKLQDSLNFP